MSDINVTVLDAGERAERAVTTGTKAWELFADDPEVIAARVDGEPCATSPTSWPTATSSSRSRSTRDDGRDILRHSTAHVLAQAVQELFPDAKLGIGPPIADGFYYDFDVASRSCPRTSRRSRPGCARSSRRASGSPGAPVTDDEARAELADEPYKLELIGLKGGPATRRGAPRAPSVEVGGGELTIYDNLKRDGALAWKDLCRGPHLPTTKRIPAFKLMRSAPRRTGAATRRTSSSSASTAPPGRPRRRSRSTCTGSRRPSGATTASSAASSTCSRFPDEIGSGLAVFHPKGGVIKREMEDYVRRRHIEEGFEYVGTPHITKEGLFHTSGHLPYYADGMFPPMEMEGANYYLKAMNCPMHNLIFRSRGRSYRELPLRLFEFGSVYRYEKSGVVHGLTRVRGMTQDDSHSYVTTEQAPAEIKHLLDFVLGPAQRLRARRLLPRAVHPRRLQAGQVRRLRRGVGGGHRGARGGRRRVRPRAGARPGRRGVLRPEDLGAGPRRDRPHLADVDHPVRLQPAARASSWSTRPPTAPGSSR